MPEKGRGSEDTTTLQQRAPGKSRGQRKAMVAGRLAADLEKYRKGYEHIWNGIKKGEKGESRPSEYR